MTLEQINQYCKNTFVEYLEIEFTKIGDNYLEAKLPVNQNKLQPSGFMHGGVSLAFGETLGGAASYLFLNPEEYDVFGIQISANHLSTVKKGINIFARAELVHKGKTTHVWDVKISTEKNKLISTVRVTNMIVKKKML